MDRRRRGSYLVSVRGRIPPDLKQRISALHARAILERMSLTSDLPRKLTEPLDLGQHLSAGPPALYPNSVPNTKTIGNPISGSSG